LPGQPSQLGGERREVFFQQVLSSGVEISTEDLEELGFGQAGFFAKMNCIKTIPFGENSIPASL